MGWATVVFLHGDEGREVVGLLENVDGVVAHGADDESIRAAVDHLAQWVQPEAEDLSDQPPWGRFDKTADVTVGGEEYVLAWNLGLGYVSLNREGA